LIKAVHAVGDSYQQEFYAGVAEDMAQIVAVGVDVVLSDGTPFTNCLQTLEWNPLEPGSDEYKFYAPGVGLVREGPIDDSELIELADVALP
jgi:hypothetical protein